MAVPAGMAVMLAAAASVARTEDGTVYDTVHYCVIANCSAFVFDKQGSTRYTTDR